MTKTAAVRDRAGQVQLQIPVRLRGEGREFHDGPASEVRALLDDMQQATHRAVKLMEERDDELAWVVSDDARKSITAIVMARRREKIGSELLDNLNAPIHVRVLLTDLFLFLASEAAPWSASP